MTDSEAREQFEKEYPPPTWAVKANGEAGKAIHFSHLKREWEGFEKGYEAGRLQGLSRAEEISGHGTEKYPFYAHEIASVIRKEIAAIREKK